MSKPRIDPQWAEVERMLQWIGGGEPGERQGTLFSDEARLILRAVGRPETLDRDKIAFLITDLCERHLEHDPELGICNAGTVAFKAADQIMTWATGADNEAARLRTDITEIIAVCEQDARDQNHNAGTTGFGRHAKAYAEGRGTACKGIAARLKALLPASSAAEGETQP